MSYEYEPLTMMPCEPGWKACYRLDNGTIEEEEVAMWAICQVRVIDKPHRKEANHICGMTYCEGWFEAAEVNSNFMGYRSPRQSAEDFAERHPLYSATDP